MTKWLRNRIFLRILLTLILILAGNRLASPYLSRVYVDQAVERGMALVLERCASAMQSGADLGSCAQPGPHGDMLDNLELDTRVCIPPSAASSAQALPTPHPLCGQLPARLDALQWSSTQQTSKGSLQRAEAMLQGESRLLFRSSAAVSSPVVLIRKVGIEDFMGRIWSLRDWVFRYVAPLSLFGILLMTWILMQQVMRPLREMRDSIARLSPSNLDKPMGFTTPYREFAPLVGAFDDLRGRLHASFMQSQRFAADASHELRTPLTILRGHIEQAIEKAPAGSSMQVHLRVIEDEVTRMADLTEKLLLLSRVDAEAVELALKPLDLSDLLETLVLDGESFQSTLTIRADIEPGVIWRCDAQLIRQLVYNLFSNALNYNVAGGWVRLGLEVKAGELQLTVQNPTRDFHPDEATKVFDRFYRGSARFRKIEGQGLGLSICQEIAQLHHGRITLTAEPAQTPGGEVVVSASLQAPLAF